MANKKKRGFTLIEMTLVVGILAVFVGLMYTPLIQSLRLVDRETSILEMDKAANRALNAVTGALRQALLPVAVHDFDNDPAVVGNAALLGDIRKYAADPQLHPLSLTRFMNNAAVGFGTHGETWLRILAGGSDFLPFTVPVPLTYADGTSSVAALDSCMLPQLGIFTDNGGTATLAQAGYHVRNIQTNGVNTRSRLLWEPGTEANLAIGDVLPIHPALASLDPATLNFDQDGAPSMNNGRYADNPAFPGGAYGVIRFVPFRDGNGIRTIREQGGIDLNEDGSISPNDLYVLGRIEIDYLPAAGGAAQLFPVSTNLVLRQLNTDSPSYRPLFTLRRQKAGGYALDVALLMCDFIDRRPADIVVRRYESSVELRNMKFK